MKYFILLTIVALAIAAPSPLSDEEKARLKEYSDACKSESSVDSDILKQFRAGTIPVNDNLKKHLFCVNKKIGLQNEDGTVNTDAWKTKLGAHVPQDKVDDLIKKCAVNKGSGPETAYESAKCLSANNHQHSH